MESTAFLSHYDASARNNRLASFELHERSWFRDIDMVGLESEQKARLFGHVVFDAIQTADSLSGIEDREDKLDNLDLSTLKRFNLVHIPQINDYYEWLESKMYEEDEKKIQAWVSSADSEVAGYAKERFSHVQIHDLNRAARYQLRNFARLALVGDRPERDMLRTNQEFLAINGLRLIQKREKVLLNNGHRKSDYLKGANIETLDKNVIEGTLNEIDCGIALLQASLDDPEGGWWVLPAPPQFEYLAGHRNNADFLIIDTARGRSLGIQVKSSGMSQEEEQLSDTNQIVYVSGRYDLGNSMTVNRLIEGYDTYSYAGGLAMAFISGLSPKSKLGKSLSGNRELRYAYGSAMTKAKPQTLKAAAQRVSHRIQNHL